MKTRSMFKRVVVIAFIVIVLIGIAVWMWLPGYKELSYPSAGISNNAEHIVRGKYIAQAGNCFGCHTTRGGAPFAGGRELRTVYGTFIAPNITPDAKTGLGQWSADDFWRALHYGKSRDGSLLYPAFPYPNYTKISRADADALFAYLKTIPAVEQPNKVHDLKFPYNQRYLLRVWQGLYFEPGVFKVDARQSEVWNRGAYLVEGLGHCGACHTTRNLLGGPDSGLFLAGALIPTEDWYAPSLTSRQEAALAQKDTKEIVSLLRAGVSSHHAVFGPMADVVYDSLQHLAEPDVHAMAVYLQSLPQQDKDHSPKRAFSKEDEKSIMDLGRSIYEDKCVECHSADGKGFPPRYPPLVGNRSLLAKEPVNVIRIVLNGGFPPGTASNPQPFGMPPYGPSLSDKEIAAVVSYIRGSWGNEGSIVIPSEVNRYRSMPID